MKPKRFRPIALLSAAMLLALASCGEGEASSASSSASAEPSSSQKTQESSTTSSGTGITPSSSSTEKTRLTLYFWDEAFVYDGQPHSLEVTSPNHIPEALVITYTNNDKVDAGVYQVTASISDPTGQYEFESTLTATLTIEAANIDLSDFVFEDKSVEYDGFAHTIVGTGAPAGLEPAYIIREYDTEDIVQQAIDAGRYFVEARFEFKNYIPQSRFAILTITPAEVDKSGIVFEDLQVKYDGNPHKIVASGTIPSGLEIEYNYVSAGYEDGYTEPGTYDISARFYSPKGNYEEFYLFATLTITPEEKIIDDSNFKDATTTYDGNTHAITVDSSVLPQDVYEVLYFLLDEDGKHMDGAKAQELACESDRERYVLDGNGFRSINFQNAGTYKLQAEFLSESGTIYAPLQATLTIDPYVISELPLDDIGFKDQTWDYDGHERAIRCLQTYFYTEDGLFVSFTADYKNNVGTEIGTYEATATLIPYGGNFVFTDPVLHATLTIGEPPHYTEGLQFGAISGGWAVTGYTGADEVVEIPARFHNGPVTYINADAFTNKPFIKKIIVGENVTDISNFAFRTLFGLEELHLPAALKNPGSRILPYISYSYGGFGPRCCTVYLPLEEAELPWTSGEWAADFRGSIVYGYTGTKGEASDLSTATQISGNKTLEWADTTKGRVISKIRDLKLDECVLPSSIDNVPVVGLAWGAGQYLTQVNRVVLPDTYTKLGAYAFAGNAVFFQMTIPSSITEIGEAAFADNNNLVLYFEADEASETFDANWNMNFPTSAVHFGYKTNIVTSNPSFDYRLDGDQNAIIVRTKADSSYHLTVPTEIDGHPVIGLDGHALDYKNNHYVTLNENLNPDYVALEALYGTTLGCVVKGGYSGPIRTFGGYTFVEGVDSAKLVDTGDMAAVFNSSYSSAYGRYIDIFVRYIGNEKDVILGEEIAGKELLLDTNVNSPIFTGSQTLETLTYTSAVGRVAATNYCTALRSIDATNSSITRVYRTFTGSVNLETYRLSKKTEYVANGLTYGAFKLHTEKDEYSNEYLGNSDNKYLALVTAYYSTLQDPGYVEIHDGCVVADIDQFYSYKGVLVIPESLAYSNNSTFGGPVLATKASSRPAAAATWPGNIVLEYEGERGVSDDGYSYLKTKNGAYIYKADGSVYGEEYGFTAIVPAEIDGLPVYAVGSNVFVSGNGFSSLGTIVFSEGIKRIENNFTQGLYGLKNITFPDSAEFIGSFSLNSPETLNCYEEGNGRYLGNETNHCIYLFELLDDVTEIELPETVVGCNPSAFSYNDQITKVVLDDKLGNMPSFRSCTALAEVVLPAGVNAIPEDCFQGCSALTSVVIPEGITTIGANAFYRCSSLASVDIPASVKTIGGSAFNQCSSLTQVTFHEGLETIAEYAFSGAPIKEARLPKSLKEIGNSAFSSTQVAFVEKNVEIMGMYVFSRSSTIYVALPEKPEGWKDSWANNATVYWNYGGSGVEGNFAYHLVNGTPIVIAYTGEAEEFVLPATIHSSAYILHSKTLTGLEFETLNIHDGILNLIGGFEATKVIIDSALTDNVDYSWTVTCDELTLTDKYKGSLHNASNYNSYHFNAKKVTFYVLDSDWDNVEINGLTEVVIGEGITTIYEFAFLGSYLPELAKVTLPSTLKTIEASAFSGCANLKGIDFPSGLVSIGNSAFKNCGIERYYIPASVTTIGQYGIGFSDNNLGAHKGVFLEASSIPSGFYTYNHRLEFLSNSSGHVYLDCDPSMTFVDTDDGYHYYLTNGGTLALYRYDGEELNDIVIPATVGEKAVTSVEARVFAESNATSLTLPEGLVRIGDYAFAWSKVGSSGDFSIKLPSTLTTIGNYAFHCAMISKLYVPATVLNVGYYAFGSNSSYDYPMIYVCHTSLANRPSGWDQYVGDSYYTRIYYYAETKPTYSYSNYWRWVDGVPTNWTNAD